MAGRIRRPLDFYWESYIGGKDYLDGNYLQSHRKETKDSFNDRENRVYYPNFCRPIIEFYTSHLLRKDVVLDLQENEAAARFLDDVDRRGTTLDGFRRLICSRSQIFGRGGVIVDKLKDETEPNSRADEQEAGTDLPFFRWVDPRNILDFQVDEFGNLAWIEIQEMQPRLIDPLADTRAPREDPGIFVRILTRDRWVLARGSEQKGEIVDHGDHGLGIVPFVWVLNQPTSPTDGLSTIRDIAYLNREIFNIVSLVQEFLYRQAFSIPAIPYDLAEGRNELQWGTTHALYFPSEARQAPFYLTAPSDPAQFMLKYIDILIGWIRELAKLPPLDSPRLERPRSGESRRFDFSATDRLLADKARHMEQAEKRMWELWFRWQELELPEKFRVDYPEEFSVSTLDQDLQEANDLKDTGILSPTFAEQLMSRLYGKALPKLEPALQDQINQEISIAVRSQPDELFSATFAKEVLGAIPADRENALSPSTRQFLERTAGQRD